MTNTHLSGRFVKIAVILVVLIAALLAAFSLGRSGRDSDDSLSTSPPAEVGEESPTVIDGVPVGYARTEAGAVEAARNFGKVMASVSSDADAYRRSIRTLASPEWMEEAEELAENGLDFLADRYGEGGSFSFVPARYRVTRYSEEAAAVELWGVTLLSGPKIRGIEESWVTGTIELVWIDGDWRVAGQASEAGPTPELLTTEDSRSVDQLDGFEEF